MNKTKFWSCFAVLLLVAFLILGAGLTCVVDPFFHYHAPLQGLNYPLTEQRYQNDGIIRHFEYDALITGTSMTENFLTSELDALFGVRSVKIPFSGGTFREIDSNVRKALEINPDLKLVIRSMDGYMLAEHKDSMRTDAAYPSYLYDDSLWNDVSYVLNKEILLKHTMKVLQYTVAGQPGTSFDEYSYWGDSYGTDVNRILKDYAWDGTVAAPVPLSESDRCQLLENLEENVLRTARENPDVDFYYFYPPYSIYWWFGQYRNGTLERQMEIYELATEQILECENIHLFSFTGEFEYVTRLENYLDMEHYGADMNSRILQSMHAGSNRLTEKNWQAHWKEMREYYASFDYASCFAEYGYSVTE